LPKSSEVSVHTHFHRLDRLPYPALIAAALAALIALTCIAQYGPLDEMIEVEEVKDVHLIMNTKESSFGMSTDGSCIHPLVEKQSNSVMDTR